MLVIHIWLWPGGDESRARLLGRATIVNDCSGAPGVGNYDVTVFKRGMHANAVWKRARVEGFPRMRLGVYDLAYRALRAIVGSRNPERCALGPAEVEAELQSIGAEWPR